MGTTARRSHALLCSLADPEADAPSPSNLDPPIVDDVVVAADGHGVLTTVARKLREAQFDVGTLPKHGRRIVEQLEDRATIVVGQTMLLEHYSSRIMRRFAAERIRAAIVKGPVFADRLYRNRFERPFTDVDILINPGSASVAGAILTDEGFEGQRRGYWDTSERKREFQWRLAANKSIMIELHENLVHSPALRHRVSFALDDFVGISHDQTDSAAVLLIIAIIHASCGHKFHRLRMLVDVLQAVRALPPRDVPVFEAGVAQLAIELETVVALGLISALFGDPRARELAATFGETFASRIGSRLITTASILDAVPTASPESRLRRHAFRWLQATPIAGL